MLGDMIFFSWNMLDIYALEPPIILLLRHQRYLALVMHPLMLGRVLIGLRKQVRRFCTISDLRLHLCKSTWRAEARNLENPSLA